jgi:hypothetical protein
MFPLPCFSVPSQTADPVRVAIVLISFVVNPYADNRARKVLTDRIVYSLSLIAPTAERNLFSAGERGVAALVSSAESK